MPALVDELLASGALTDLTGSSDSLQHELDKTSQSNQVELELAQLKGQLGPGEVPLPNCRPGPPPDSAGRGGGGEDGEITDAEPAEETQKPKDMFTLDSGSST